MRLSNEYPSDVIEAWTLDACKRATNLAALHTAPVRGRGDKEMADDRAVLGMREGLNKYLPVRGVITVGEGLLDEAPMLYVGEELGPEGPVLLHLAVDPIDGTNPVSNNTRGGLAVIAGALMGEGSLFINSYEGYMDKFVVGPLVHEAWVEALKNGSPRDVPNFRPDLSPFDQPLEQVVRFIAWASNKKVEQLNAGMLSRERNGRYLHELRKLRVQCTCEQDGDIALAISVQDDHHELDFMLGIGGSPEAVIAAAGVRVARGQAWFKWWSTPEDHEGANYRLDAMGISPDSIYTAEDLATGNVFIAMSAITDSDSMRGVRYRSGAPTVTTFFGRSRTGTDGIQITRHLAPPVE